MKKVLSLLLCIILVSGCGKLLNKSQPVKTDNKVANTDKDKVNPSPSPSFSPTPRPTSTPTPTPSPSPSPLPEENSVIPDGISKTEIGILIGSVLTVLVVLGILWKFSCCCFGDKKSGKPASIPNHLRPNVNTKKDNPHNPFSFVPNPASAGDDNAPPFGNNGDLQGVSFQGSIPHL
ncbi:hypothetical protein [Candidatus Endomicrobiellum agilis]|uniref:hypothetical protein n=1 Tax=Candidatus Endomicrobiellum agilis TaxID=3238957 RepID=UPI00357D3289|nr:hypothetical protein [Endomicrobium sp.]